MMANALPITLLGLMLQVRLRITEVTISRLVEEGDGKCSSAFGDKEITSCLWSHIELSPTHVQGPRSGEVGPSGTRIRALHAAHGNHESTARKLPRLQSKGKVTSSPGAPKFDHLQVELVYPSAQPTQGQDPRQTHNSLPMSHTILAPHTNLVLDRNTKRMSRQLTQRKKRSARKRSSAQPWP